MQRQFRPKREPRVEDLREKLNRIKQEKLNDENGVSKNLPPPDPTYNFLKDPMRGDDFEKAGKTSPKKNFPKKQNEENVLPKKGENLQSNLPCHNKFERNKGPQDEKRNQNWRDKKYINKKEPPLSPKEKPKHEILNQLPLNNIKVEFSGETGQRKCILDESKIIELPKVDESKFTKQSSRETQKYYYNRQTQERRSFRENKSDNKKEFDKGTETKQSSNYKKNYKQKRNYKKTGEESVEHTSEDNATTVENAPCENNDAHEENATKVENAPCENNNAHEENATKVENAPCENNDAHEENATRVENAPCENNDAHGDHELIKSPIVKIA